MTKQFENAGKLALIKGNKEYGEKDFEKAKECFRKAIEAYSKANLADEGVKQNLSNAYLNLSATLNNQNNPNEAIKVLEGAKNDGHISDDDCNKNLAAAYYKLGLEQSDDDAVESFKKANDYMPNHPSIQYHLGISLLKKKEFDAAAKEFQKLLLKEPSEDEFPLDLELNAHCKLIECKVKLKAKDIDIKSAVQDAAKMFSSTDRAFQQAHEAEAVFIYNRLVESCLLNKKPVEVEKALGELDKNIPGIGNTIITQVEQNALHLFHNGAEKEAITELFSLAHVGSGLVSADLLEAIKNNLDLMAANFVTEDKYADFALKVLGDIGACDYSVLDNLFV